MIFLNLAVAFVHREYHTVRFGLNDASVVALMSDYEVSVLRGALELVDENKSRKKNRKRKEAVSSAGGVS